VALNRNPLGALPAEPHRRMDGIPDNAMTVRHRLAQNGLPARRALQLPTFTTIVSPKISVARCSAA
jgi:hypothetical protein